MTREHHVCCNGAGTTGLDRPLVLDYRPNAANRNVRIGLPRFIQNVFHLPPRILDLLELAAYLYAADRNTKRGRRDAVEFHSWARSFRFRVRVRDLDFWSRSDVQSALATCLTFMTGDASYSFDFSGGHKTPPTSLFDQDEFVPPLSTAASQIALFSGGLDSLGGALQALTSSTASLVLVSHQSQPGTKRTQKALVAALQSRFPKRVTHYAFECTLSGDRAAEETQRTRSFLYGAIAFAIAQAYGASSLSIYENGVTSLNLRRREDLSNARASRTTHPKTLGTLTQFLSLVADKPLRIETPAFWLTKKDVASGIANAGHGELIASSVSCSRTFRRTSEATQCGHCFQCIDRRLAIFAAGLEKLDDSGLYAADITTQQLPDEESKTTAVDYLRQAAGFAEESPDEFYEEYISELADVIDHLPTQGTDVDQIERVWQLLHSHGSNVRNALRRMRDIFDDPLAPLLPNSLPGLVSTRDHLRPAVLRLSHAISRIVTGAIGDLFRTQGPKNENDLNAKLAALIGSHVELASEHPSASFACAIAIPDHEVIGTDLMIEAKFIRGNTPPSKAAEGIAADLTKYPASVHILFLVYDPTRRISNDAKFRGDVEAKGRCSVTILR